jgi:exodeoxyribonuclease III
MRVATWNVNSLKIRLPRIEGWIAEAQPDVLCMQETKLADDAFPHLAFAALGYESVHHGEGRWNGVAIVSKVGIDDVTTGLGAGVEDPYEGDARVLAATCGGIRFVTVYVPNGRAVDTEFYERKLVWLDRLVERITTDNAPDDPLVVCGDWNIAPEDRDVWDPVKVSGGTHVTDAERARLARLREWGLVDAFRGLYPDDKLFSWWDYRAGDFHQGRGMRIDYHYVTAPVVQRVRWALIDRNARKGSQPSDHAPVFLDLAD